MSHPATHPPTFILGAGLTGLSTAYHLQSGRFVLVERSEVVGGKARSHRQGGHTFDVTGHWLHLRDDRVRALVQDLFAEGDLVSVRRKTNVWSHGALLHYPFQANLYGLPPAVVQECLEGFFEAQLESATGAATAPRSFEDFARARFGAGISKHFFVPYNTKLWGMHPDKLTAEWVSRYIPIPDAAQVIGGAVGVPQEGLGYNVEFQYPKAGGIDHLPARLGAAVQEREEGTCVFGSDVEEIDVVGRRIKLSAGEDWQPWTRLVSTIPLPELIKRIPNAPDEIQEAASALRWVRWRYLDVATKNTPKADYHWVYVPERRYPFFRVGVYSNAVESMAPQGRGSLYVELEDRTRAPDEAQVAQALTEMGTIGSPEDVDFMTLRDIDCAYVVFDDAWRPCRAKILDWLDTKGVHSCGRYGAWVYNSMEDSMIQGMDAAAWVMRGMAAEGAT
ncbi:MAG: protoporphyrinogen/coproporphyrinogen oxidase [Nannocystaceae bacterium]